MDTLCQLGLAASALIVSLLSGEGEVLTNNTRSACGRALSVCSNLAIVTGVREGYLSRRHWIARCGAGGGASIGLGGDKCTPKVWGLHVAWDGVQALSPGRIF